MDVSTFPFDRQSISCYPSSQFEHLSSQFTSHPANELMTDSNNSRFVNVVTAPILVELIILEGIVDDEEENREGLDGDTC